MEIRNSECFSFPFLESLMRIRCWHKIGRNDRCLTHKREEGSVHILPNFRVSSNFLVARIFLDRRGIKALFPAQIKNGKIARVFAFP